MTRTAELLKQCDEALAFCNKCGYVGKSEPNHVAGSTGATRDCDYQALRQMFVSPETIRQLVELVRLQHEALKLHAEQYPHMQKGYTVDALEAFNKWENGK